jgi:hypothetical protein
MRTGFRTGLACIALVAACNSSSTPSDDTTTPASGTAQAPGMPQVASGAGTTGTVTPTAGSTAGRPPGTTVGPSPTTPTTAATSGSGANTGVAGTGATTTAGTMAPPATSNGKPDAGEFFVSGSWHGYAFAMAVGAGSTVMPMDFKMQTTGMPRCIKGSVGAADDYSGTAMLGFGLNEDGGNKMTVTPMKAGVLVEVTNNAGSPLRFQVEGPSATEDSRWCTQITGSGGFIPWSSLKTKCWGSEGTAYNNEPIVTAMLLVPGDNMAAVPFDFCVNTLAEADGGASGAAGSGGSGTPSGAAGMGAAGAGGMPTTMTPPTGNNSSPGSCDGYATGYWDCCKPHCGWKDNVGGSNPLNACDAQDNPIGSADAQSACNGGNAYQCHNLVPWAVNDQLAYGYSAVPASQSSDICGKCFELQFMGQTHNSEPDPGSTALAGKRMIVQAVNIGSDVANGQFDLLVPGRGVGMFDACTSQWGVNKADLGETYGGFLLACQKRGNRQDHAAMKSCVMQSCMNVFEANGLMELAAGCKWFIDWFQVADNPALKYKQVSCPAELSGKGIMRNSPETNMCLR